MWEVYKKENCEIWTSNLCKLEIEYKDDLCKVLVNFKGYNIILAMGIWGFEEEIQKRKIKYDIEGEKGKFFTLRYIINKAELNLFCDLIYFFLSENNMDSVLNDAYKFPK